MRIRDDTQNLPARIRLIQILIFVGLVAVAGRLYQLQIIDGARYTELARNQRIRMLPVRAPRGAILDREGRLLVSSRPAYNIVISREEMTGKDFDALVEPLARGLDVDTDYLRERFEEIKRLPAFETINIKENASPANIAWIEAHQLEFPELGIEEQPQRIYPTDGLLAHVLGYTGEISSKQLELPEYKEKGYKPGDIIGREGLEATYDESLRGRDGSQMIIVDSLGHPQGLLKETAPQPGQDLVMTIDLDLQRVAEEQLKLSPSGRGVVVAMNPNNGEILAMASYPTFDPNLFSERITSKAGRKEYARLLRDSQTPLYNRAIRGRYPPGSTWKIPMAMGALMQGAITLDNSRLLCGGGIWVGNKFTRCMGNHGRPDLHTAIMKSCDAYFYRLGLRMGLDGIMKMVDDFGINKKTGIDLPGELSSWTPSREFKARFNPRDPEWRDIDTVYASFGQVYDFVTPLALLRTISGIAMGGRFQTPHLLKEFRAVGSPEDEAYRPAYQYKGPPLKIVPLDREQNEAVRFGMWAVVNDAGTARRIRMEEFEIAGKTGTAQVVGLGKDVGEKKDHAWFVSYAPADKPEIAVVVLIENAGFGATHAAPVARKIFEAYYQKTRGKANTSGAEALQASAVKVSRQH